MSSGNKRLVINTQERSVSNDYNRGWSFSAQERQDLMRSMGSREISGPWMNHPGLQGPIRATPSSPPTDFLVTGDVYTGLLVQPDLGAFLRITPGTMGMFLSSFAGLGADDTPYIMVVEAPGVTSDLAELAFVANGGGTHRWDIVECQPVETIVETQNRDIFNTTTGQFVPAPVTKVSEAQLTFRIRAGDGLGNIPDPDPEWTPLAAVHVRTDSTGFLDSDVYDIRPYVPERCPWSPGHDLQEISSDGVGTVEGYRLEFAEAQLSAGTLGGVTGKVQRGYYRAQYGGYWVGGRIRRNTPSATLATFGLTDATGGDADHFNGETSENRSNSLSIAANTAFHLCAHFPRGYPRWVRYSQTAISPTEANRLRTTPGRIPQGPRGILWLTDTSQTQPNGHCNPNVPPAQMVGSNDFHGHFVSAILSDAIDELFPPQGGTADDKYYWDTLEITRQSAGVPTVAVFSLTAASLGTPSSEINAGNTVASSEQTLTKNGTPIPQCCRAVCLTFPPAIATSVPNSTMGVFRVQVGTTATSGRGWQSPSSIVSADTDSANNQAVSWTDWVTLNPQQFWDGGSAGTTVISFIISGTNITFFSGTVFMHGYQL